MKRLLLILLLLPVFATAQIVETIVGNGIPGYSGDGGLAIEAELYNPLSVKFDQSGNMYIADQSNNVIRKVDPSGIITTVAGTGTGGYSGDGGPATAAEIKWPTDIAFDASGNLYIADLGYDVIRKVTPDGIISTIAGTGTCCYNGDGIPATSAQIYDPLGLVFDNAGNLFFGDNGNHRVRKISTDGIITTVVGKGTGGYSGDGGLADSAKMIYPGDINFDHSGNLYIPDYANHRIRMVNAGDTINTIVGNGIAAYTGIGGPADSAEVAYPWCILFDDTGNYYITDDNTGAIHKISTAGIITAIAGNGTPGYSGDGGPAIDAEFGFQAACTAIDTLGNLYIADYSNNRIRRIVYTPTKSYTAVNNVNKTPEEITISPNPTTTALTIRYSGVTLSGVEGQITITNLLGQTLYQQTTPASCKLLQVDVSPYPPGIYLLKINGTEVRKFVKE